MTATAKPVATAVPGILYLKALEAFDAEMPGFAHDTHGVQVVDGRHRILCLTEE